MISSKANAFFRYLAYSMEIVVAYVLGSTPNLLPDIFGAKPVLLLCVALTAAIFEREMAAMIIGMICGVLIDLGYSNGIGFFTIALTIVCFIVGYASNNLIVATFRNFLLYSFVAVGGLFLMYFVINFVWGGVDDRWTYFVNHLLSRMIQTFICSIVFYLINKLIHNLLGEAE